MPDEQLRLTGAVYFAPLGTPPPDADADLDQGDEPAEHPCPACVGGWHGEHCQETFWTTGEPPAPVECDCIEGACRGEWIGLGYVEASGAAALRAEERARRERPIGPPLPVDAVEHRPDGVHVTASLPPGHPAYAAVHEGLTDHLSIAPPSDADLSDSGRSVNPVDTRSPVHASFRGAPLPSPAVTTGLGREHIDTHRQIPAPGRVELPEALGGLAEDAPEQELVRYNRADRRRLAKTMRRQARRG